MATYTSQYPPAHSDDYVKATTKLNTLYWAYFATDPALSLTGLWDYVSWIAETITNQRFHIDLGSAKVVKRIYYENNHYSGGYVTSGVQNFTFWGSNTGAGTFDDLVYANDEGWTQITAAQGTFDQHVVADQADPKYITVTNSTAYRYYAFKFPDNYGGDWLGVRRIELQTQDILKISGTSVNTISTIGDIIDLTKKISGTSVNTISTIGSIGVTYILTGTSVNAISTLGGLGCTFVLQGTSVNAISTTGGFGISLVLTGTSVNVISTISDKLNATLVLQGTSVNVYSTIGSIVGLKRHLMGTSESEISAICDKLWLNASSWWTPTGKGSENWAKTSKGSASWAEEIKIHN